MALVCLPLDNKDMLIALVYNAIFTARYGRNLHLADAPLRTADYFNLPMAFKTELPFMWRKVVM